MSKNSMYLLPTLGEPQLPQCYTAFFRDVQLNKLYKTDFWPITAHDLRSGESPAVLGLFQLMPKLAMQERPCTRCMKRNIGHLCHDEPREPMKRAKLDHGHMHGEAESLMKPEESLYNKMDSGFEQQQPEQLLLRGNDLPVNSQAASALRQTNTHIPQVTQGSNVTLPRSGSRDQQCEQRLAMNKPTMLTFPSFGLQRLEPRRTKSIARHAHIPSFVYVQCARSDQRIQSFERFPEYEFAR